jgi:hypothetical protein
VVWRKNWSVMPFVPLAFEFEMAGLLPCWLGCKGRLELAGSSPAAGSKLRNRLVASTFPSSGKKISHFCSFLFALLHSIDLTYNLIYHVIFTFLQSCFRFNRKNPQMQLYSVRKFQCKLKELVFKKYLWC